MSGVPPEVALAAAVGVVVLTLGWAWRWRRSVTRRLEAVTTRLEAGARLERERTLELALARLERAADAAMVGANEAATDAERLAAALAHVPGGVVVCDEHGEVVFRNADAAVFEQGRHGEVLAAQALDELLRAALAGAPGRRTLELYGPPRRMLELSAEPLDDGNRTIGVVALVEDVSERRRLEAVRRDFVANMSHELKTPVGGLGLLAETIATEDNLVVIHRLATRMHTEALRVARIIDDLLDLSRIESEEAPLREPVPVHLVVAEAVERVRPVAEHRGITIDVQEAPRRLRVVGDRRQLVSAVHHLLENAVKYSEDGAEVTVRSRTDGTTVELAVRDTGIGIPTRDLERIFERFYRVDRSRARDTGGTGLGLAIVRHIASNHGGEIRVDSQEGRGSTFTLRLPAGPGPVAMSSREAG